MPDPGLADELNPSAGSIGVGTAGANATAGFAGPDTTTVGSSGAAGVAPLDDGAAGTAGGSSPSNGAGSGGTLGSAGTGSMAGMGAGTGSAGLPSAGTQSDSDPIVSGADPTESSISTNGPYEVQSYSLGFAVGPDFPGGTIWHPANGEPPFASIAIVPGFVSPRVLIEAWGPFLASHGIVTFTIDTNAASDQPAARSRALLNALESLKAENTRADSPLRDKLDNDRQAVGGWSMGGGGTLITVNSHPELKAAIAMCSWQPSGRFTSNTVPTLLFASAGDPLAGGQSQGFYRSIPESTPKILFEWGVADHLLANAPTGAAGQVGRLGLSWLKVFLEDDERYRQFLLKPCEGCTDYESNLQ